MARKKSTEALNDPATGKALPVGVACRGVKQYRARKLVNGQRVTRTFDTARLARQWLEDTSSKARAGQHVDTRSLDGTTLRDLVERYRDEHMRDRDCDRIGHVPAVLADSIAGLKLSRLTPASIRGFRERQLATMVPATAVKRLNLLSSILNHAIGEWDVPLPQNPASGTLVKRPAGADRKRNRRLLEAKVKGDKSEYDLLLEAIAPSPWKDDVWLVRWAIEQATRLSEATSLQWKDIDMNLRTLSLDHTKTGHQNEEKGPEIRPLMPGSMALLRERLASMETLPSPEAFIVEVGNSKAFSVRFGRMTKRAGILDLRYHDLRHEATSRLARLFPNPLDLRRVTGHRDLKSLDRYYQPVMSELANDAAKRASVLARVPRPKRNNQAPGERRQAKDNGPQQVQKSR